MHIQHLLTMLVLLAGLVSCASVTNTPATAVAVITAVPSSSLPTVTPDTTLTRGPTPIVITVALPTSTPMTQTPSVVAATPSPVAATQPPSPVPATPSPAANGTPGGVIFFVDPDGATIKTIHPDGTHEFVLVRQPGVKAVSDLAAEPTGTYLLFKGDDLYYLVQRGQAKPIAPFLNRPRWSPDGRRFVGDRTGASAPAMLFIYDTSSGSGQELGVAGLQPDWFPDNQRLVYVNGGNVWIYDLRSKAATQLTHLPTDPAQAWAVQTPHVLLDGQHIIFFGGIGNTLGASGNGQQWWWVPVTGGQPQPWTELGTGIAGNGVLDYSVAPQGDALAWSEGAHASACESDEVVTISTVGIAGNTRLTKGLGELDAKRGPLLALLGLSWAPDSNHLALALQPYDCDPAAHPTPDLITGRPNTGPPAIFVWNVRPNNTLGQFVLPTRLVNGSYPVWTK